MMSYAQVCPTVRVAPTKLAADTWVIQSVQETVGQPLFVYLKASSTRPPASTGRSTPSVVVPA